MENFNVITQEDRQNISYGACLGGATLVGMSVGRFVGLGGLMAGAVTGLAIGLLTCKKLSPVIERKLFSTRQKLTERELLVVLKVLRDEGGVKHKSDAMHLLSLVRSELSKKGENIKKTENSCMPMKTAAKKLITRHQV